MGRSILRDVYEIVYDSVGPVRAVSTIFKKMAGRISPKFREKINDRITVKIDDPLQFYEGGSVPYGGINVKVKNDNHSSLRVSAVQITVSLTRHRSTVQTFYWDENTISDPPSNITISKIPGKRERTLNFDCMLPYYLYFPNKDMTLYVEGTFRFDTDVGEIEHQFRERVELLRDPLWNMSTVQEDLVRKFSPGEPAFEKESDST